MSWTDKDSESEQMRVARKGELQWQREKSLRGDKGGRHGGGGGGDG